ncbi:hypothetical protein CASFOL_039993 [Castilleja foliolosa]|uniref:Uncharacterized protein n=1 Tax=Castilleja foliolosa TaxID=1961234 RepID=A0ABD3BG04_9LAMI
MTRVDDDIEQWTKSPSFLHLQPQVELDGGKTLDLSNYPNIFMVERAILCERLNGLCGLTITGFYYVCFSCSDGSINGYYYDPNSSAMKQGRRAETL